MPKLVTDNETPSTGGVSKIPALSVWIDKFISAISMISHIFWVLLILVIIMNVVLRYVFGNTIVAFEELQWHIYSAAFMIGVSYCLVHDQHVRVDVLAEKLSVKSRARIEIAAMVLLVIPFAFVILKDSIPFIKFSYKVNEISGSPGGLPYRWIIKSMIPFSFGLLILAAFSRAIKMISILLTPSQEP